MPVASFAQAQEILAARLPGYTRRAHQIALAEQVEQHLADGKHLLAQAGTGTGKSLALGIPAVIRAVHHGERTVFAVPTKALQDQYVGDFTFLQEHLDGDRWKFAVLKGRANYPCLVKAQAIASPTWRQQEVLEKIAELTTAEAVREGLIIDRESFPGLRQDEWNAFSMPASECPGASSCPLAHQCFAERAKTKAADADVVITNMTYFLLDLLLRQLSQGQVALLGEVDKVILDEAHMLPDAASSALEDTLGEGGFAVLARDIAAYLDEQERGTELAFEIEKAGADLWAAITELFVKRTNQKNEPVRLSINTFLAPDDALAERFADAMVAVYNAIETARDEVVMTKPWDDAGEMARARLMRRSANAMSRIWDYTTDPDEKTIRWIEREDRNGRVRIFLRSAPLSVAPFLNKMLFSKTPTILSSATLAAGTDFSPLMETIGLSRDTAGTYDAGSPFDYPRQARLFVPGKNAPAPNEDAKAWRNYAQGVTRYLVSRSRGGALLLFTSRSAMSEAYETLADDFRAQGLTVLRQDGETPVMELIRTMKQDGNAVLFALRTFFEGVDIQGEALRLVVIDKLPFGVPTDPKNQARDEAIEKRYHDKWAPLNKITVPNMILILTQAFGRLIRHRDDRGVVAILDNRLRTKRYGARVLNALPNAPVTENIEEAAAFLSAAVG